MIFRHSGCMHVSGRTSVNHLCNFEFGRYSIESVIEAGVGLGETARLDLIRPDRRIVLVPANALILGRRCLLLSDLPRQLRERLAVVAVRSLDAGGIGRVLSGAQLVL